MTDTFAPMPGAANNTQGAAAMSRLADRLAAVAPPAPVLELTRPMLTAQPRFSPAVTAALSASAAINARAERRARRSRSIVGLLVDGFVATCSFIPYALVALGLRLVMARVFFFDGQTRIDGPRVPLNVHDFDLSVVLPLQVKAETFAVFLNQYAALPVPPMLAAYLVSYGEFVLPIMLVLGFGTRIAALGLLIMTAMIQVYVMPQALWNVHIYWASILMVLLALGPGQISVDAIIRFVTRRA
jgi:putative oxidoreductase